jgi:hypothetical protein
MRQILVDYARRHAAAKPGSGAQLISLDAEAVLIQAAPRSCSSSMSH